MLSGPLLNVTHPNVHAQQILTTDQTSAEQNMCLNNTQADIAEFKLNFSLTFFGLINI